MSRTLVGLLLGLGAVSFIGFVFLSGPEGAASSPSVSAHLTGTETPREGCLLVNGWNLCTYGDANLRDGYLRYQELLGEPVSSFDARCQTFTFGQLCFNPANPPEWRTEWANLGLRALQADGFTPQPGAEAHPAVRAWIFDQMEIGLDPTRVVGRIVSAPRCDRTSGQCRQWSDKQLFLFPQTATSGQDVQRAPLGAWTRPAPSSSSQEPAFGPISRTASLALLVTAVVAMGLVCIRFFVRGSRAPVSTI